MSIYNNMHKYTGVCVTISPNVGFGIGRNKGEIKDGYGLVLNVFFCFFLLHGQCSAERYEGALRLQ